MEVPCAAGGVCLDAERALAFASGELVEAEREDVERRIDACRRCRLVMAEAARRRDPTSGEAATVPDRAGPRPEPAAARLVEGEQVGRYVIERPLGAGGMGVVSLARDPELHRPVVIKLVRTELALREDREAFEARLRREAQAMALVSHPNVVQIFDIGNHGDRIFIAMEFVDGVTLDGWLAERPRTASEILGMLRQVGAGLEAAHRAGLVHRDVKPSNILVGRDGVAKVTDFGLARARDQDTSVDGAEEVTDGVHAVLTSPKGVVGTPAFMSPEQALGGAVDARTDQYAFAVTAFDALVGQSASERAIEPARAAEGLSRTRIPARARAALVRALSAEPAQRFARMTDLVAELEPRHLGRWLAAALALAVCASAGAVVWFGGNHTAGGSCPLAAVQIARELPATTRQRLDAALRESTPAARATAFAADVQRRLDSGLARWSERYDGSCPRPACLDAKLDELASVVDDAIEDPSRGMADLPVAIAKWTDELPACRVRATESRGYLHQMARALAYWRQERPERAIAAADTALALATDPASILRARLRRIDPANPTPEQLAELPALYDAAQVSGDPDLPAQVALVGAACPDASCAERWASRLADSTEHASSTYRAELAGVRGELAMRAGQFAVAVAMYEDEIRQITAARGANSFELIPALGGLADAHGELRAPEPAMAAAKRADDIARWWLGEDHPYRANTLAALGVARLRGHDLPGAIEALDRAIALRAEVEGADSPRLAALYNNLATCYQASGKPAQAIGLLDLAIAGYARRAAPDPQLQLDGLRNAALVASELGRDDAQARLDQAFAIAQAKLPPDHATWTRLYELRGVIERRAHHLEPAAADLQRALAGFQRMGHVAEVAQIGTMATLAGIAIERKDLADAGRWVAQATRLVAQRTGIARLEAGLAAAELSAASGDRRGARAQLESIRPALADPALARLPRMVAHFHLLAATLAEGAGDATGAERERVELHAGLDAAGIPEAAVRDDCAVCPR